MCKEEDRAPTFVKVPGEYNACSDHWKEFSAAIVKPPAKAKQAALAKTLFQVSVVSVQKKIMGWGGQRPSQSPVHSGFFTPLAGMTSR